MFSLICASQLAFNAFFSFLLNSQKFTPYIVNALFLLTVSSSLLVFNTNSTNPSVISKEKYTIGVIYTVASSAGFICWVWLDTFAHSTFIWKISDNRNNQSSTCNDYLSIASCNLCCNSVTFHKWRVERFEERNGGIRTWDVVVFHNFGQHSHGMVDFHHRHNRTDFWGIFPLLQCNRCSWFAFCFSSSSDPLSRSYERITGHCDLVGSLGLCSYLYQHSLDDSNRNAENNQTAENHCIKEIALIPLPKEITDWAIT